MKEVQLFLLGEGHCDFAGKQLRDATHESNAPWSDTKQVKAIPFDYLNLDSKVQAKQLREELRLNNEKVTFNFINWFLGYPAKIATLIGILFILTIILLFVFSVPELCADGSKQYNFV